MEKEKKTLTQLFGSCSKKIKAMIFLIVTVLVVFVVGSLIVLAPSGKTTYSAVTSLKEILESSQLSTSEYTYNSIVKVPIDPDEPVEDNNIKYQIYYKGTVKSGFDLQKVEIIETNGSITVVIPKIEIQSVEVNTDLEYIFTKEKYDAEDTYAEAYNACCKDLKEKASSNKTLYSTAIESAVETLTALSKPFEKQLEDNQTIKIVYIDNYISEG